MQEILELNALDVLKIEDKISNLIAHMNVVNCLKIARHVVDDVQYVAPRFADDIVHGVYDDSQRYTAHEIAKITADAIDAAADAVGYRKTYSENERVVPRNIFYENLYAYMLTLVEHQYANS